MNRLSAMFLLAAAASGRTLRDVSRWLDDPGSPTPAGLLDDAGHRALASSLLGAQHGAPETRDGIYQTARTAAKCLHDEEIMAWVTPPRRARLLPTFDPARFTATRDVLYLVTESRSAASPLIAGLTGVGMQAGPAVSAVLLYRLATYWLPVLPGWVSWRFLQRREYL